MPLVFANVDTHVDDDHNYGHDVNRPYKLRGFRTVPNMAKW